MNELVKYLLGFLGGGGSVVLVVVLLFVFFPEKLQIWGAMLLGLLGKIGVLFRFTRKQQVKYDIQGRVNHHIRGLSKQAPYLATKRVQVKWTEGSDVTRKGFLQEGKVILRLRREDPNEANFVHATYLLVSTGLLHKVKRYISPSQGQAVDLYVASGLLRDEKPSTVGLFLDEYLHQKKGIVRAKLVDFLEAFKKIDEGGLFYQVLLQELDFLGDKVFGRMKDDKIVTEVTAAIEFLERVASRKVGEKMELNFCGNYCRFAIVVVGTKPKMTLSGDVYINYIKKRLVPQGIETLYVVGTRKDKEVIDNVCAALDGGYETYASKTSKIILTYGEGEHERREHRQQYLVILRKKGIDRFQR